MSHMKYIAGQKEHHRIISFLQKYGIEYEDRYGWKGRSSFTRYGGLRLFSHRYPALALPQSGIAQTGLQICQPCGPVTGDRAQETPASALRLTRKHKVGGASP